MFWDVLQLWYATPSWPGILNMLIEKFSWLMLKLILLSEHTVCIIFEPVECESRFDSRAVDIVINRFTSKTLRLLDIFCDFHAIFFNSFELFLWVFIYAF